MTRDAAPAKTGALSAVIGGCWPILKGGDQTARAQCGALEVFESMAQRTINFTEHWPRTVGYRPSFTGVSCEDIRRGSPLGYAMAIGIA